MASATTTVASYVCRTASGSVYVVTADGAVHGPNPGVILGIDGVAEVGRRPIVGGRLAIVTATGVVRTSELVDVTTGE